VIPGVSKADKILLWTGGIWGHFDGQVLIKAMKRLEASHPDVKLVFFGTQHPNPNIPEMKESVDTRKLSSELGLSGKTVFFNDGWVPYGERINYLLESDVAINTHKPSIEPEFSHRTRVLDHFLAGLPTIATEGDYLSDDVIKALSLGIVVPPDNDSALAEAILKILKSAEHQKIKQNINSVRKDFDWSETMRPLIDFLNENPTKLALLDFAAKVSPPSRPVKIAKKVLPVPVKKALIRILRMK
jgi:glycosyltransferase involved in cell wall biosynthesis